MSLFENLNSIYSIKNDIKSALENKGVDMTSYSFPDYPSVISDLSTGGNMSALSVSVNGTYYPEAGYDGFSEVSVNVFPSLGYDYIFSSNGFYAPEEYGYDGFAKIGVDVPQSVTGYTLDQVIEGDIQAERLISPVSVMTTVGCWSNVQYVSMNNLKEVPSNAFNGATFLSEVHLDNCSIVGMYAFGNCPSLTEINLPNVTQVINDAFNNCMNLQSVTLPRCESIGGTAFAACTSLTYFSAPNVKTIEAMAFQTDPIPEAYFPNCLTLGYGVFYWCSSLSRAYLPALLWMQPQCFNYCSSLTELTLCMKNYRIPVYDGTLDNTPLQSGVGTIYVADTMYDRFISAEGWSSYSSLVVSVSTSYSAMLSFSNGLLYGGTTFLEEAFNDVIGIDKNEIVEVSLPACELIEYGALGRMESVTSMNLPALKSMKGEAFVNDTNLTYVSLPVCEYLGDQAFQGCGSLTELTLPVCSFIGQWALYDNISKLTLGYSSVCYLGDGNDNYNRSVYVPASLVDAYKTNERWAFYSSLIFPISE